MTQSSRTLISESGDYEIRDWSGEYWSCRRYTPKPSVHVRKALKWIRISEQQIKLLKLPDNYQINEMSEVAHNLIESGLVQMAGRVDLALYRWLELDANA